MTRKGSYAKGVAKREEILTTALDVVATVGYSATTVRELADAVGLTQNGLLYYFGSKEQLFVEIIRRRDRVDGETYATEVTDDIGVGHARFVRHNAEVPGLVQLSIGLSAEATSPSHPAHEFFAERFEALRREGADVVRTFQERGDMPSHLDPEKLVTVLMALSDGLQLQWLYKPGIDMAEHFLYLWELLQQLGLKDVSGAQRSARPEAPHSA